MGLSILKPPEDWPCPEWGVWGMVPNGMLMSVTNTGMHRFKAQKLLNDAARVILNTAHQAWELRNTQVLEWEGEQPGLIEQKRRAQRRQRRGVGGGTKAQWPSAWWWLRICPDGRHFSPLVQSGTELLESSQ